MASDLPVAVRIHQYLRTLSSHLRERAAAMLLAEARDEIERLRLTDEERQAIDRQADWLARKAQEAGDIHSADLRLQEAATLRGLLERTK
jgi:leucyl aminopeptidase (aminopeptidase T)